MTRKDYVAVAKVIAAHREMAEREDGCPLADNLAEEMARVFATDNPAFDRKRFLTACGVSA